MARCGGCRKVACGERGQNIIEMAILLPLLLLLLVGVVDFARAFNNYIVITNASREGARYASRFPHDDTGIKQAAIDEAATSGVMLDAADVSVVEGLNGSSGDKVEVTVTYHFPTFLGSYIDRPSLTLASSTEMVIFGLDP